MTSTPTRTTTFPAGKVLTSAAALFLAVGAFAADWNDTHVFNPDWPPHAKFHNGQTLTLAVTATAISLWQSWRPGPDDRSRLRWATLFGGLTWATQVPATFFPGAALVDPDNALQPFTLYGIPVNQVTATAAVVLPLLGAGYALEAWRQTVARRETSGKPSR